MYNQKSILLLLFFFIVPLFSSAQEKQPSFEVAIGEALKKSERKSLQNIVAQLDEGFIVLQKKMKRSFGFARREPYHLYLQRYNQDLELVKEEKLKIKKKGERLSFRFMVQLQDKLFLFASVANSASGRESLLARQVNEASLEPTGEWVEVAEVENRNKDGFFSWSRSKDKGKLLLLFSSFSDRLDRQSYSLFVLNEELNQLWHKQNCLPYPLEKFSIVQHHLDNAGNVYLLNTLFREGGKNQSPYQYHLLAYKNKGNELHEYGIELPGKFLEEIKVSTDEELNLVGGGFYADEAGEPIKGAYSFRINGKTNEVVSRSNKAFAAELIPQTFESQSLAGLEMVMPETTRGTHQLRQSGFELNDIVLRKDGSALLLGEQYFVTTTTHLERRFRGSRTETKYFYKYKDVLLVSIDREGVIEWTRKVGKQQYSQDDSGLHASYLVGQYQDKLCLLFNNYSFLEGEEDSRDKGLKPVRRSETVLVKVYRNGAQQKEIVSELDNNRLTLIPRSGIEAGEGSFVLLGGDQENHHFIRFSLKDNSILSLR